MTLVVFPDTDIVALEVAEEGLAAHGVTGIDIATELPSPPPARLIRLFTIPGREVCRRTMWCQVIGFVYDEPDQDVRCSDLARLLAAVLRAAPESAAGDGIITEPCELRGPFPSRDPEFPHLPRYQVNLTWTIQSSV